MKACSVGLAAHLAQGQTTLATLFKITRQPDAQVFGFTDHDEDIVVGGVTYISTSSYNRFNLNQASDATATTTELVGAIDSVITRADLAAKLFDGADVQKLICNWKVPSDGDMILATGTFGPVTPEEFQFRVEIRGMAKPLEDLGGETCGPSCRTDFGSAKCAPGGLLADGTDINSLLQTGTVVSTDGVKMIVFSGMTDPGKPNGGNLNFLTGANSHLGGQVKSVDWATSTLILQPGALLLAAIAIGDTFSYFPACDFTFVGCVRDYKNGKNYQGEPHAFNPDESLESPDYVAPHP